MKARNPHKTMKAFAFGICQYSSDTNEPMRISLKITNEEMLSKIISGEHRGLSPAYTVRKWECSICHKNLEECTHEVGKQYDDQICQMIAHDIEPTEVSLVDVPEDSRCRVFDLLIVKNGKNPEYIWYGFRVNTEFERFRNIQRAYEEKLIPAKATFFFSKFFAINSEGKAVFS